MTTSSAQRCTPPLVRLGFLRRRTPAAQALGADAAGHLLAHAYLCRAHAARAGDRAPDRSEPGERRVGEPLPSRQAPTWCSSRAFEACKRFHIHTPVGRRLPMYCTASGRAYLSALPAAVRAQRIVRRSDLQALTPHTLTDPAARSSSASMRRAKPAMPGPTRSATAATCHDRRCRCSAMDGRPACRGQHLPHPPAAGPWRELRAKLAPLLLQTARAASPGAPRRARACEKLEGMSMPELSRSLRAAPHHHDLDRRHDRCGAVRQQQRCDRGHRAGDRASAT